MPGPVHASIRPEQLDGDARYRLLSGCVVPRPIAFVSTVDVDGARNLAAFSFFNLVGATPPIVMVSVDLHEGVAEKDTSRNIRATGEFVVNTVTEAMAADMVHASVEWEAEVDEVELVGFETLPSERVRPERIARSPVQLECRCRDEREFGESTAFFGEVVAIHVDERALDDGKVLTGRLGAIGRLAGSAYCRLGDVFQLERYAHLDGAAPTDRGGRYARPGDAG